MTNAKRHVTTTTRSLAVCLLLSSAVAVNAETASLQERVDAAVEASRSRLIELRRGIHRHPELAGEEKRTSEVVAKRLRELGLEVETGVGGYGVVGVLKGGVPGPVVALRADMDASVSDAPDPVEFASETPGVRHICGHDIHTTVAVGVAEALAAVRGEMPGTLKLLFQPAEETGQGAAAMVADGAMNAPSPSAVFAFHTAPLEVGQVGSTVGVLLPATSFLELSLRAEEGTQPDFEAAAGAVFGILPGVATMGPPGNPDGLPTLHGIPLSSDFITAQPFAAEAGEDEGTFKLQALLRTTSDENLASAKEKIAEALQGLSLDGLSMQTNYIDRAIPGAYNDPTLLSRSDRVFKAILGEDSVVVMGGGVPFFGEDFAHFHAHIPGVMYWLGVSNSEKGIVGMPHDPAYVADEEAIFVGAKAMSAVLLDYLAGE